MKRYDGMDAETFVDWLLDEFGLLAFVRLQCDGLPEDEWDWDEVAHRISYLSDKQWQPTPSYVSGLYAMQVERAA